MVSSKRWRVNWNQQWHKKFENGGYFHLSNGRSGKCLDVPNDRINENQVKIQQWDCIASSENQQWMVADGQLRNRKSGKCIDVPGWSPLNGARLTQHDCHGGGNQKWVGYGAGWKNQHSGKCLDLPAYESYINGAHIQQWDCIG